MAFLLAGLSIVLFGAAVLVLALVCWPAALIAALTVASVVCGLVAWFVDLEKPNEAP